MSFFFLLLGILFGYDFKLISILTSAFVRAVSFVNLHVFIYKSQLLLKCFLFSFQDDILSFLFSFIIHLFDFFLFIISFIFHSYLQWTKFLLFSVVLYQLLWITIRSDRLLSSFLSNALPEEQMAGRVFHIIPDYMVNSLAWRQRN